jgi:hypothetical protein
MKKILFWIPVFAGMTMYVHADSSKTAADYPVFVAKVQNPNDYNLFANGGWDGNWYVGFNTFWIKKLPPIPPGSYTHAYIGAKIGRMKLNINPKNIWDKKPVPGSIYMAIASTTAWSRERSYFLTNTETIPLEGDAESAVEGTGESEWFWAEIPLTNVNYVGENYLALWSPTPELIMVSSSPVLAAAWGGKDQDTWLTRDISGAPPRMPTNMGTPISYFQPAMALKLIPKGPVHSVTVQVVDWKNTTGEHPKPVVTARVEGDSIQKVWVEYYIDHPANETNARGTPSMNHTWAAVGRPLWKAPYIITIDPILLPPGRVQLRVAAANIWEERGASSPFTVDVSTSSSH